ncbi:MAG: hypothetical protein H0W96_02705 [Solirubrobacterales bacterium]|nr:hypothetical protein [Solirubrobacterales bacterium]
MEASRAIHFVPLPFLPRMHYMLMRPQDNLVLEVVGHELAMRVDDAGVPWLVPEDGAKAARLVVRFPPAHIAEQVFQEHLGVEAGPDEGKPEQPSLPAGARFASPSRLAFVVTADDRIELTIEGILGAMGQLALAVVPLASPRQVWSLLDLGPAPVAPPAFAVQPVFELPHVAGQGLAAVSERLRATRVLSASGLGSAVHLIDPEHRAALLATHPDRRDAAISVAVGGALDPSVTGVVLRNPDPRPPRPGETAIEIPSRLQLSPSVQGGWAHATGVDAAPGEPVELWHTRLGVRVANEDGSVLVDEDDAIQRIVRGVWTRDLETWDGPLPSLDEPFRMSTQPRDRRDIVGQSTRPGGRIFLTPAPVEVQRLYLTSLGAFMDVRGAWTDKSYGLEEWQHRATLGRDQYVKVVRAGFLFPFGHRASLVTETRRKVDPTLPRSADTAILWQRHFIILREPTRAYDDRRLPFTAITLSPKTTPDINDPGDALFFWPRVGTKAFPFTVSAVDHDGDTHVFPAPLLFVKRRSRKDKALWTDAQVLAAYGLERDAEGFKGLAGSDKNLDLKLALDGKRIHVAPKAPSGDAAFETIALRFAGTPSDDSSTPELLFGDLVIPAVAAATGRKDPQRLTFAKEYVAAGFDAVANKGEVVLGVARDATPGSLSFGGTTDKSGGFLDPGQKIEGVSRRSGPVADLAKTAVGDKVDPASLFAGMGKLFGLFELGDVLGELGLGDIPEYASRLLDIAAAVDGGLDRVAQLLPDAPPNVKQAKDALALAAAAYDALNAQLPLPDLATATSQFQSLIVNELLPAVQQAADDAVLAQLDRAQAEIARRALDTVQTLLASPPAAAQLLAHILRGEPVASMLSHVHLEWSPPLQPWPVGDPIFIPELKGRKGALILAVDVRGGAVAPSAQVLAQLTDFSLQLIPGAPLLNIGFERLMFKSTSGAKSEVDVVLADLEWQGVLGFVAKLKELIPLDGFSDPPSVEVDASGIQAGFSVGLPNLAIGVFNLSNLSLEASLEVPFVGTSPMVGFSFCARERPFTLAVMMLGGGGFFGLQMNTQGLTLLEASIEFGAALALDFGVASGSVSIMTGVYLRLEADDGSLTGYLRIRGEVDVLGLISASIEMYMGLTYEFGSGKVIGRATITVEVEVLFFSGSVEISAERRFAGSNGDPTFEQALGPYADDGPWAEYCQAFAGA